jgi:hypothetical protein
MLAGALGALTVTLPKPAERPAQPARKAEPLPSRPAAPEAASRRPGLLRRPRPFVK